ncbi:DEAD/DEAH box helicase [Streptomyces sp. NPDC050164]|uniref:DEAD/DEAH box helicase n=1 Tax=Streptomyces sp. NPDC050164 TaxID=3365605 RepID=UPI00379F1B81
MTLPVALSGSDVIGQAKTGTGKTLGFGLPLLERVTVPADVEAGRAEPEDLTDAPQALVVVPTRELCTQVTNDLLTAGKVRNVRVLAIYGGRAYEPQVEALKKGVDVVVGTPGRLLDLAGQKKLNLKHVRCLVLDEADEMLDLGFLPDVEKIINMLPVRRQTMLFSATMPGAVIGLARRYMSQPTHISATAPDDAGKTVANTKQYVYRAHNMDKPEMVARILQADGRGLVMVFCRTKRTAADLADQLQQRGFASGAVHGDLGQGAREQALRAFRNGKVDVLVCTDVAARGIDVEGVTHVINYQSPEDEKTYLHRIGRTGRAGAKGIAITLVDWDDIPRWQLINKALDLGFNDPPETYSTSPHLYADLGIPEGTKGVLPRSERKRAGLAAEELEDLGETGGRGPRGRGGHGRGGRDESPSADRERSDRTPRRRRRMRGGTPLDGTPESTGTASDTRATGGSAEAEAVTTPRTPRRRRRTRGGAPAESAPVTAVESPAPEPAENAVATAEGTSTEAAKPRRQDAISEVVAAPVTEQPEAPAAKPRRRTRKATAASAAESAVDTAEGTTESAPEPAQTRPRRTRTTAAKSEAPAAPAEAAAPQPRRTRKAAAAAEDAVDTAETAEAKPRRTRKATAATEDSAGEAQATEPKPRRTRKTAAAAETAADTAEGTETKPRRRTRKATAAAEDAVDTAETAEAKPRRTRKTTAAAEAAADTAEGTETKPRRRTRKAAETAEPSESVAAEIPAQTAQEPEAAEAKPRRARKATAKAEASVDTAEATEAKPRRTRKTAAAAADAETAEAKPRRTRKTTAAAEAAADTAEGTETKPRRRTRKVTEPADIPAQAGQEPEAAKPRRTRKTATATASAEVADDATEAKPKARRTRKATAGAEPTEG